MVAHRKITPEIQAQICAQIRAGNYLETAAQSVGVSGRTLRRWMRRGEREGTGIYAGFCEAVAQAKAEAEVRDVLTISAASKRKAEGDWHAAAWKLERMYPDRFGRRIEIVAKEQALEHILRLLKDRLDAATFALVVEVLSGGEEDDVVPSQQDEGTH